MLLSVHKHVWMLITIYRRKPWRNKIWIFESFKLRTSGQLQSELNLRMNSSRYLIFLLSYSAALFFRSFIFERRLHNIEYCQPSDYIYFREVSVEISICTTIPWLPIFYPSNLIQNKIYSSYNGRGLAYVNFFNANSNKNCVQFRFNFFFSFFLSFLFLFVTII